MKSDEDLSRVMETYADMVRRICFVHLKNRDDTEDIFQNVYLKYLLHEKAFASDEHEKAWFARVTINACRPFKISFPQKMGAVRGAEGGKGCDKRHVGRGFGDGS